MTEQKLVRADVACQKLGITRDKLSKLAKSGKISSMRLPTGRLYDVDEYIARGGVPEKAPKIRPKVKAIHLTRIAIIAAGLIILIGLGSSMRQPAEKTVITAATPQVEAVIPIPVRKPVLVKEVKRPKPRSAPKRKTPCNFWREHCK